MDIVDRGKKLLKAKLVNQIGWYIFKILYETELSNPTCCKRDELKVNYSWNHFQVVLVMTREIFRALN